MPSHRLILEKARSAGEWLLEWDANKLTLHLPDGNPAFEVESGKAHYIIDLHELDFESKVCFKTPAGELKFKRNPDALRDVRSLVLQTMKADPGYQERYERIARIGIPLGIGAFFVCGGLFALYCWWASWAPDPPPGNWLYYVGWLIHLLLLVLLAGAIGGPIKAYYVWRRVRQLRRATALSADGPAA
jgi:hypothetical protein